MFGKESVALRGFQSPRTALEMGNMQYFKIFLVSSAHIHLALIGLYSWAPWNHSLGSF